MTTIEDQEVRSIPEVTEHNILEVEKFLNVTFDDPRRQILRSNESFDVEACPGSGKTTLIVAKLAILASKWPYAHRGICVLSHTNVARQEVESRLAGSVAGYRLLEYPHFVGTIHGFVNRFLALPILRSEGHAICIIDDHACFDSMKKWLTTYPTARRIGRLIHRERTLDGYIWSLVCAGDNNTIPEPRGIDCDQWDVFKEAKSRAIDKGLWFHKDMFAWSRKLLKSNTCTTEYAQWRFPAVFIDEMQDTSEMQNEVLSVVFPPMICGLRQRFGDPNQAIYDYGQECATTDPFLGGGIRKVPNSMRFGSHIASKAEPLAPIAPDPQLIGEGPQVKIGIDVDADTISHTIFCFDESSIENVLPAFGKLLLNTFPVSILKADTFVAKAIGRVKKLSEQNERIARNIPDYWGEYQSNISKFEPRPDRLADFLHLAQRLRSRTGDCNESVVTAAKGIIELIRRVDSVDMTRTTQSLKWLRDTMVDNIPAQRDLQRYLWRWCVEMIPLVEDEWPDQVLLLRKILKPVINESWTPNADTFCQWSVELAGDSDSATRGTRQPPNRYVYSDREHAIVIDVGTIHSAKGQTHTATLVLETFYKTHDLSDLLPWLSGYGDKPPMGKERKERMRLVYTAMTRPTHLLCLAMRKEALGSGDERKAHIEGLKRHGWEMKDLT